MTKSLYLTSILCFAIMAISAAVEVAVVKRGAILRTCPSNNCDSIVGLELSGEGSWDAIFKQRGQKFGSSNWWAFIRGHQDGVFYQGWASIIFLDGDFTTVTTRNLCGPVTRC